MSYPPMTPVSPSDELLVTLPAAGSSDAASEKSDDKDDKKLDKEAEEEVVKYFKNEIAQSKRERKTRLDQWRRNVHARLGKTVGAVENTADSEIANDLQSEVNPDWSLTKTKTANLFSQVPVVRGTHLNKKYAPAIQPFLKQLNYDLGPKRANVAALMEECLADAINAAGFGCAFVKYVARFDEKEVPDASPMMQQLPEALQSLAAKVGAIKTKKVTVTTSAKIDAKRFSPKNFLWPKGFEGSDFDDADWLGRDGSMPWGEAKNEFKLKDEDKATVIGDKSERTDERLSEPMDGHDADGMFEEVEYQDIYYWRHRVDPDEKSLKTIWRLCFVKGIDKPVIHEQWKGQELVEGTYDYVGSCKYPIRVLTLTYISDNPIPPSDTEAGQPQVADMRLSRSQMFMNRRYSTPLRWFDSNRVNAEVRDLLMRGYFQGFIPTNGEGSRVVGEIARASYPGEDLAFDRQVKGDLMETWQVSPAQSGVYQAGERTKAEVELTQANFTTRIGQERFKTTTFFLGIVEVMAGYEALYSDFPVLSDEERQTMEQAWDRKTILHDLVFDVLPDSTIVLDSEQRIQRALRALNMTMQSGLINPAIPIAEIWNLSGFDAAEIMMPPSDKRPDAPNISYRFSGKDDLMNVAVMSLLVENKQNPSPQSVETAKAILADVGMPFGQAPPQQPGANVNTEQQAPPVNPDMGLAPKIASRSADMNTV